MDTVFRAACPCGGIGTVDRVWLYVLGGTDGCAPVMGMVFRAAWPCGGIGAVGRVWLYVPGGTGCVPFTRYIRRGRFCIGGCMARTKACPAPGAAGRDPAGYVIRWFPVWAARSRSKASRASYPTGLHRFICVVLRRPKAMAACGRLILPWRLFRFPARLHGRHLLLLHCLAADASDIRAQLR